VTVPGVLFLDGGCGPCSTIRDQLARRDPIGLTLASASEHPQTLWLARNEAADGHVEHGVAAVARGIEHLDLFWANVGWLLRLPGVRWLAQLISDGFIVAPHPASRNPTCPAPPPPPRSAANLAR
jgi:hypothetical protein